MAEKESLSRVVEKLKNVLGDNLLTVVVFGSRVRGDFHGESDFDVLVILKRRDYNALGVIIDLFYDEEERTGITYSVVVKDSETFDREKNYGTGFYRSILEEGKVLYGKIAA